MSATPSRPSYGVYPFRPDLRRGNHRARETTPRTAIVWSVLLGVVFVLLIALIGSHAIPALTVPFQGGR